MVSPLNNLCVFWNPCFDMVNGIWADFYHLMLDNVSDLDTRSGIHGLFCVFGKNASETVTVKPHFKMVCAWNEAMGRVRINTF